MAVPKAIMIKSAAWGHRRWFQRHKETVTGCIYSDTTAASYQTHDSTHALKLVYKTVHGNALRGEDYPALVSVWDNDVDAAIYDTD